MKIILPLLLIAVFIIGGGVYVMRKDMPYSFEVVPSNGSFWIYNTTSWADKDCSVKVTDAENNEFSAVLPGQTKSVQIKGLRNDSKYKISIARKDFLGKIKYHSAGISATPSDKVDKYVVLVGASVGRSWKLKDFSQRVQKPDYFFGYRGLYEFDKTPVINSLLKSEKKPDTVIIKECAAYFPRETSESINQIDNWVSRLSQSGIQPVLATVVPVTRENDGASNNGKLSELAIPHLLI